MFTVNTFNDLEPLKVYLLKPDNSLMCCLNSFIDAESAQLSPALNQMYEISFNIYPTINVMGKNLTLDVYEYLVGGMYLVVEKYGYFKLKPPKIVNDGTSEYKEIIATTCDCELKDKTFKYGINLGLDTSLEYLVEYEDDETEPLLDAYTGIPYDWIVLYNTYPEQLENFKTKLNENYFGTFTDGLITVTNLDIINEICTTTDNISRIKANIEYDESGQVLSYTENFEYTYDDSNTITKITIYDSVLTRIDELISFYEKYRSQLSLLDFICSLTNYDWTVGEVYGISDGDYSLANKRFQFDANENIYSFLTQTLAESMMCMPIFDIVNRKINIIPVENLGTETGAIFDFKKLVQSVGIECDEENLVTKLYVYGKDDLDLTQVNYGEEFIEDLTYIVNSKDSNGKRIYVSDELAEKYLNFKQYQEDNRESYIELTKKYNQCIIDIDELKYRVPNDNLSVNWGSYSEDDLQTELVAYKNTLNALITLYKNDYSSSGGVNSDGSVNTEYIKTTEYWYDYYAYTEIITQINIALATFPNYSNENEWTESQQEQYSDLKNAYKTEWSLYGSVELQSKIDSLKSRMSILISAGSVIKDENGSDNYVIKKWDDLTDDEQSNYVNEEEYNNSYELYNGYYEDMTQASLYLNDLLSQISQLEQEQEQYLTEIKQIKSNALFSNNFTLSEQKILNKLFVDAEYTNENILTTSLNDVVDSIDVQKELLLDAQEKISILSRPQLIFTTNLANLFGLVEFEMLWNDFKLGNFIMLQYQEHTFAKLRLVGFSFNPLLPSTETLDVSFSNFVISKSKIDDCASLFGLSSTDGISSYGSSSSGGSGGIDTTISNTMLQKLLSSETFGTRINNVILDTMELNELGVKKAIFGSLATGNTIVNGKCISTGYITDKIYNGQNGDISNTKGSIINLENGQFSFAGGSIKYDGQKLSLNNVDLEWTNISGTENVATKDDINNISIGARNLLEHTKNFEVDDADSDTLDELYDDFVIRYMDKSGDTEGYSEFACWQNVVFAKANEEFILSFYAKGTGTIKCCFYNGNATVAETATSQGVTSTENDGNIDITLSDEWERYWVRYTIGDASDLENAKHVSLRLYYGNIAYVCGVQFERGNIASDWTPSPNDINTEIDGVKNAMVSMETTLTKTCEEIVLGALETYVSSTEYGSFKETTESELQVLAEQISLKFTETVKQIESINGSLQEQINTITTYFDFDINGLTIGKKDGEEESPYKMVLDNESLTMFANGTEVLWINGATKEVYTPALTVTGTMNLFGFTASEDSDDNVNWDYTG